MSRNTKVFLQKVREIECENANVVPLTATEATWRKIYKVQYHMRDKVSISLDKARIHLRDKGIIC